MSAPGGRNAAVVDRELAWLAALIDARVRLYFGNECAYSSVQAIEPPNVRGGDAPYERAVCEHGLSFDQRAIVALALAPCVRPQMLDALLMKNPNLDRGFTEFGGIAADGHGGFWPTVETAAFILAGADLERRFAIQSILDESGLLVRKKIVQLERTAASPGPFSAALVLGREFLAPFTTGSGFTPVFGGSFPAKRLVTRRDWSDLVLAEDTLEEVEEIRAWIRHRDVLLKDWRLDRQIMPGFRTLFYGPPGTGKTFTASLLGKTTGLDVYRVDLSRVVSKWVGETEKNLSGVFDQAENHNWILFFDEADALFGKRTQTSSSHDRYANQEVAYLLQRVEDFPGVVILASNLKGNIDDAFARRFQSMIYFAPPGPAERLRLWNNAFPDRERLDDTVDLEQLAQEFAVTGGAIVNVLRYASLMAVRLGLEKVRQRDIRQGVRRELRKDGKVL